MEHFLRPTDTIKFLTSLLTLANSQQWILVAECPDINAEQFLIDHSSKAALPDSAIHHYDKKHVLAAFTNINLSVDFVDRLTNSYSALSIFDHQQLIFLIADDFHEDCFSCSDTFFTQYKDRLADYTVIN